MLPLRPEKLDLIGNEVAIRWNNGSEDFFSMEVLRAASPSAENQGEPDLFGHMHGASEQTEFPGVRVIHWQPVGQRAANESPAPRETPFAHWLRACARRDPVPPGFQR